ncbi:putative ABC multidrug transporter [Lojkania enalia]|uniref:ABC multidrug transporter n=1 Tax=Lojkania enalia TaxID=147567 RepID=A0A9P4K1T1_9PLEO|nr:putative ABC multidrug transporter [Didymosphaeria enalia]
MSAALGIHSIPDAEEWRRPAQANTKSTSSSEVEFKDEVQQEQQRDREPFTVEGGSRLDPKTFHNAKYSLEDALPRVAGVAFRGLNVWGYGSPADFQSSVENSILKLPSFFGMRMQKIDILRNLDGLLLPGEQLCVLGPPGSGCSTLLKTIAGDTHGFKIDPESYINYQGITPEKMRTAYCGEAIYTADRTSRYIPGGICREIYAQHLWDVIMAMFGISHTINTKVGNEYVRGVSGGERKRVTIVEVAFSYAPLQCRDNSTRGLDSVNAVEFCRILRTQCDVFGSATCEAIYQAPQSAYDQFFFGPAAKARAYFERLGFQSPESQTTADFLTSMTSPAERIMRPEEYARSNQLGGHRENEFALSRKLEKSRVQRKDSPYTLSEFQQIKFNPSIAIAMLSANIFEALIIASIFYNLPGTTASFFSRGAVLFMIVLLNAFGSVLEIMTLYAKREVVEKHKRYALYHPSGEALVVNSYLVNLILYFMANLRREPWAFFFFYLVSFMTLMSMSMFLRFFASIPKTIEQALAPSSTIIIAIVIYTGFVIPIPYMRGWASWFRWLNPVSYGFESVMVNEFHGRDFPCTSFVPSGPSYNNIRPNQRASAVQGSIPGSDIVSGEAFVRTAYQHEWSNIWRNLSVIVILMIVFMVLHLITSELIASERSKGEVLVFRRDKMRKAIVKRSQRDEENVNVDPVAKNEKHGGGNISSYNVEEQTSIFHWEDVCYEIRIKGESRTILDHVDGWIKPGTLTALMGVSGAGKTTLLDVLASRTTMGVISGGMLVDGRECDHSFQRKTGYVQQQDLHLATSTVREALEFSALLQQPPEYSSEKRLAYVDQVISILNMENYADAVVGVPGSCLNVEQRKRLTIGVELAARPKLLLLLDEPTSGLDSQTSWSICDLMEKFTRNGQAILCTIHQPSAALFQRSNRLLLLDKGGKAVYFGEIGRNSRVLLGYFSRSGGPLFPPGANPAEYMLESIGATPRAHTGIDWSAAWKKSLEYAQVRTELARLRNSVNQSSPTIKSSGSEYQAFAAPFSTQLLSLLIGFSLFKAKNTQQGLQNQMFGVFMFLFIILQLIFQIIPTFVLQRTLYEARERQSKTYSWQVFLLSNILVEMLWNSIMAVLCFLVWYYPVGFYRNAELTNSVHIRGIGARTLLGIMMYAFCGILACPDALPRFWIFMYKANPYTYLVSSFLATTLGEASAYCAENEFVGFLAPENMTWRDVERQFCQLKNTNQFLRLGNVSRETRWRDLGLLCCYIAFNFGAAVLLYWVFRVPKGKRGI